MMPPTVALLIRHGDTDAVGHWLAGRLPGVPLNARGCEQVARLAQLVSVIRVDAIYSSPLERARATALSLARAFALDVQICDEINEVDFGEWTGLTFDALNTRADWRRFNDVRAIAEVPGGESAKRVQMRIIAALECLRNIHLGGTFAVASHADVIRAAVLHVNGVSLDQVHTIAIEPASITAIELDPPARVLFVNRSIEDLAVRGS
jgi:broad specificity phosphatase PhoE